MVERRRHYARPVRVVHSWRRRCIHRSHLPHVIRLRRSTSLYAYACGLAPFLLVHLCDSLLEPHCVRDQTACDAQPRGSDATREGFGHCASERRRYTYEVGSESHLARVLLYRYHYLYDRSIHWVVDIIRGQGDVLFGTGTGGRRENVKV